MLFVHSNHSDSVKNLPLFVVKTDMKQNFDTEITDLARQILLKKIFQYSHFAELDGLNEYDEDFSFFTDRGDLIPVEMREALARLQKESSDSVTKMAENDPAQQGQDDTRDV